VTKYRPWIKLLDAAGWAASVFFIAALLWKTPIAAGGWQRRDLNDYTLNHRHSVAVAETRDYPFGFTYPPPSALFRVALGKLGFELGGGLWIAATGISILLSVVFTLQLLGLWRTPGAGLLAFGCLFALKYPLEFETKYLNCNAMFLALVLGSVRLLERRPILAGMLLSLSVALKLYSAVFIPWLLFTRRFRAAVSATFFCGLWFVAVPVGFWGWDGAVQSTVSWLQRAAETSAADFPIRFADNAYLVSLHRTLLTVAERFGLPEPASVAVIAARIIQTFWLAFLMTALLWKSRVSASSQGLLVDTSLLLLLPLPLSGQLQPHHAVVLIPASMILLSVATNRTEGAFLRRLCGMIVIGSFVLMEYGPPRPWRGLVMNSVVLIHAVGLFVVKVRTVVTSGTAADKAGS
jgi:hypothetical protein